MKYQSVMDLHTHTVASGHAYCTLREMAKAASDKGLELLGITEHAPKMPGTCHKFYFQNIKVVPREMYGIQLLLGSEVNILDAAGTVDLAQKTLEKLDVVIASLHVPCIKPGSRQENTEAYLNVMKNPYVNIMRTRSWGEETITTMRRLYRGQKNMVKFWSLIITPWTRTVPVRMR